MQVVKNIFISLFAVWLASLIFMPKKQLYYTLEHELLKQGVVVNEQNIEEGMFSLTIKEANIFVKGINVASIDEISVFTLIFYNSLNIKNIYFDDSLKNIVPQNIEKTVVMNSILSPFKAFITSMGTFGLAEGIADLNSRTLRIDMVDVKDIKTIKPQLKKDEKGLYYETSF